MKEQRARKKQILEALRAGLRAKTGKAYFTEETLNTVIDETMDEVIASLGMDCKRVEDCIMVLYRGRPL